MNLDYAKNSIEEVPFGQYLEQFQAMDPEAASVRTGVPSSLAISSIWLSPNTEIFFPQSGHVR